MIHAGITYYNTSVTYNYNAANGTTLSSVYSWMNGDRQGRGIIMEPGSNKDINQLNSAQEIVLTNIDARSAFSDPAIGGFSSNSSIPAYTNLNVIYLNPNTSMSLSSTSRAVHEGGHNAAGVNVHGTGHYEYGQQGLQSNTDPKPSEQNTKDIINDAQNRSTITTH